MTKAGWKWFCSKCGNISYGEGHSESC